MENEWGSMEDTFRAIFERAIDIGMKRPFIVVAADMRGSVVAMRVWGEGRPGDELAEHYEGGTMTAPFTIMVLDQRNEVMRATVEAEAVHYN